MMNLFEIRDILRTTSASNWVHSPELGSYTFSEDPLLRIQKRDIDEKFHEEWVTRFSDPNAYKAIYDVYYCNSWVKTVTLVSVDGGRATIPMPTSRTSNEIDLVEYYFAKIVSPDNLDVYIDRAGFTVPGASGYTETEYFQM